MANGFYMAQANPLDYRASIAGAAAPVAGLMGGVQKGLEMAQTLQQIRQAEAEQQAAQQAAQQQAQAQQQQQALAMQAAHGDPAAMEALAATSPEMALQLQELGAAQQEQQMELEAAEREEVGRIGSLMTTSNKDNAKAVYERVVSRIRKEGDSEEDVGLPSRAQAKDMKPEELNAALQDVGKQLSAYALGPQPEKAPLVQVGLPGAPPFKTPAGYMLKDPTDPEKGVKPIPGTELEQKVKVGKFTESQSSSANYANRMVESGNRLDQLESEGVTSADPISAAARMLPGGQYIISEQQQELRALQDDWVRAKLRKESGAVIGEQEMTDERRTYFPQPGDKPKTIAAKRRLREEAQRGMVKQSGGAYKSLFQDMTEEERAAPSGEAPAKTVTGRRTLPDGRTVVQYEDGSFGLE